jgi:ATP-dependent Clp endopeptidase proteolytic subunit ClpP
VSIYDEIGFLGISAQEFTNSLKSLGNRRITVRINSPGGGILEGNAIYNALRRYRGGVDTANDGLGASMASVIMMAGERRSMAENAYLMIHNPWVMTFGESSDLRKEADLMDDMKENIISAYVGRTGLDRDKLSKMMDDETWLTAKEAKGYGFVTEITESLELRNSFEGFDISRFPKRPTNFMSKKTEAKEEAAKIPEIAAPEAQVEMPVEAKAEVPASDPESHLPALLAVHAHEIAAKDSQILALQNALAKLEEAMAKEIAEKTKSQEDLAHAEAYKGIAPAAVIVSVPAEPAKSVFEQYNSLEGAEQTAFYKAHQAELLKYFNKAA